jgi:hypothetical protein
MTLAEAKAECDRWFAHLDRQREKSISMQKIAAAVRAGEITRGTAQHRVRALDGRAPVVFDGAPLEQAIKTLLKHVKE